MKRVIPCKEELPTVELEDVCMHATTIIAYAFKYGCNSRTNVAVLKWNSKGVKWRFIPLTNVLYTDFHSYFAGDSIKESVRKAIECGKEVVVLDDLQDFYKWIGGLAK